MTVKELVAVAAFIGSVISGWLFLDTRHDPAGASEKSKLEAQIYALDLTIADLTSTIGRYNAQEESGNLSTADRVRRAELERLRNEYAEEKRDKQALLQ